MYQRVLRLPPDASCLLLGPRQTGKSTLARLDLPPHAWQVDLLAHETYLRYSKEPGLFRAEAEAKIRAGAKAVFVDEIQKIPALTDEIHALYERFKTRFVLTGSSARKLRRGGANLLAGRAVMRRLHPLTAVEMGDDFDLDRTLRFGSLPAFVGGSPALTRERLEAYAETYLREEVLAESLVRNLGGFARFLDVAAAQSGDLLNVSAVARDAAVAARTVTEYFGILEDTLLAFRLEPWGRSPRARMVQHPKVYFFDLGVLNALCRRLSGPIDPALKGVLFEHFVVLEVVRGLDYAREEARPFFWRTHTGAETDLVVEKHGRIRFGAEIKSKSRISGADLAGLRSFRDAHPEARAVVVCTAPEERRIDGIDVLPYRVFLSRYLDYLG
jgi:predicted AAA+ superfamily ATPase